MSTEKTYTYVDGVGSLRLIDGVVRFDMVVITEIENDKAKAVQAGAIAMSLPAAVKLRDQLTTMVNDLKDKGVLQENPKLIKQ